MSESITTDDRLSQQIEDIKREITESTVQSMVNSALEQLAEKYEERDRERELRSQRFFEDMRAKLVEDARQARSEVNSATRNFATREEMAEKAKEYADAYFAPLRTRFDDYWTDSNRESERREQVFSQRVEQILELAEDGKNRSIENEKQIAALSASSEQQFKQITDRLTKAEDKINNGVAKVERNSSSMHRMVGEWISASKTRDEKTDAIIKELKAAQDQATEKMKVLESDARSAVDLAKEVDSLAARNYQTLNFAILGNKDTKTPGLVDEMEELRKEQKALSVGQAALQTGLAWQAWIGRHPFISLQIAGALFVILVIAVALILGRPEVIGALVNAAT